MALPILVLPVIMAGLMWFTGKTKMGKAMRACSEDKAAAQLMGCLLYTSTVFAGSRGA